MASQRPADLERFFDIRLPSPEQTLKQQLGESQQVSTIRQKRRPDSFRYLR